MIRSLIFRLRQGQRTTSFPEEVPELTDRFRGLPLIDAKKCLDGCRECADACPTSAIVPADHPGDAPTIDMGRCLFCTDCVNACPNGAISHRRDHRLAVRNRADLVVRDQVQLAKALDEQARRLFGRSLKLRQVSAGGCNACESEVNVLNTIVYDLSRFGIQFVPAPRHADGLLITGPVTQNMVVALRKTYEAVPAPKLVIVVGACAISGGPFSGHPEQSDGADAELPVDLYVPGCPPHPLTILDGLLRLLGRIG